MRKHCRSLCTYARARGGDDDDDDDGRVGANVKNACGRKEREMQGREHIAKCKWKKYLLRVYLMRHLYKKFQ